MKRLLLFLSFFLLNVLQGQNIVYLEYFFDTDPGAGKATNISITPAATIEVNYNVDISGLSNGFHILFIRAQDEFGNWTYVHQNHFYKDRIPVDPLPSIVRLEYFIDVDPGVGKATNVPITQGSIVEKDFTANLTGLSYGMHILYLRVKDETGNWSIIHQKPFTKESINIDLPNITGIEYYFTKDEFISETTLITNFTPNNSIDVEFIADLSALSIDNTYIMHVYVIDKNGVKSLANSHEVTVVLTGIGELALLPIKYDLMQNFPNPFNPETHIKFSIPKSSHVTLTVYNALGQKVADLLDKEFKPGFYDIKWNGSDLASGVYFYRLRSNNFVSTKKMILVR
ncbi:MAG: T9SS type A sorting domain-containing protein [Calditrichales bacterium]|nr:T9SS type A sorting domain-containing protein [Calditrichales bacterium]